MSCDLISAYMDSSVLQAFSLQLQWSVNAVAAYIRPFNKAFIASGPDGYPRIFISIILPASKAHTLNGFLKTPVRPVCHRVENTSQLGE